MRPWGKRSRRLVLAFAFLGVEATPSFAYQNGTHDHISSTALQMVDAAQYPDIAKYAATIRSHSYGPSAEGYAHGGPNAHFVERMDAWLTFDGGPVGDWLTKIGDDARNPKTVVNVYEKLGYVSHLIEDQTSPTHAANIAHGALDHLEFQAGAPAISGGIIPLPAAGLSEVIGYYNSALDRTQRALPTYTDPAPPAGEPSTQYWVQDPAYQGQARQAPNGRYGGITTYYDSDGTRWRFENKDTFSTSKSPAIAPTQASLAAGLVAGMLQSVSKLLPPVIEGASLSPENWPGSGPLTLTVRALENRTRDVRVTAEIFGSGGALAGTPLNRQPVSLDAGSRLPWETPKCHRLSLTGMAPRLTLQGIC